MKAPPTARLRKVLLPAALVLGDTIFAFAALSLGYWLRYASPLGNLGIDVPDATFAAYLPLLLVGVAFLIGAYAQLNLYTERLLLRKYQSVSLIIKGTTFWLLAYLSLSLVLKFQPPISRWFVILAYLIVLGLMFAWRSAAYRLFIHPRWVGRLRQRVARAAIGGQLVGMHLVLLAVMVAFGRPKGESLPAKVAQAPDAFGVHRAPPLALWTQATQARKLSKNRRDPSEKVANTLPL
jgi:hypothetical protein